jgi:hypothetical protein
MKYYVIQSSNENVSVVSEWTDLDKAKVAYHDRCKVLWNEQDVITGVVMIIDSALNTVSGYREFISHPEETIIPSEEATVDDVEK